MSDEVPKINLTVADVDKAAQFYEDLIDSIVKNPSKDTVSLLTECMDALDGLGTIRDTLLGVEDSREDAESQNR